MQISTSTTQNCLALLSLGANLASGSNAPVETLIRAVEMMDERGLRVTRQARWIRSPAFPPGSGPDFANGAVVVETGLEPVELLAQLHEIEAALGRVRSERWAPRVVDIDLIACDEVVAPDKETVRDLIDLGPVAAGSAPPPGELILPHPRLQDRSFVLAPLAEIAPDWRHPLLNRTIVEMRDALPPRELEELSYL